jgi:hypothetical protein
MLWYENLRVGKVDLTMFQDTWVQEKRTGDVKLLFAVRLSSGT